MEALEKSGHVRFEGSRKSRSRHRTKLGQPRIESGRANHQSDSENLWSELQQQDTPQRTDVCVISHFDKIRCKKKMLKRATRLNYERQRPTSKFGLVGGIREADWKSGALWIAKARGPRAASGSIIPSCWLGKPRKRRAGR